jgi:hypothetical protein
MRLFTFLILISLVISTNVFGQDSDSTGQDFDLDALMGVIETVDDFEALEKAINDSTNEVNILDLNDDGVVDYVLIQEEADGDVHVAFLRIAMAEDEYQDIATIEMEKLSSTTASFQIVGDVDLYGEDYIIEPDDGIVDISDSGVEQGGKGSPSSFDVFAVRVTICVGVYQPGYSVYVSPYGFMVVPVYYHPYRRVARTTYRRRSARWHRSSYHRSSHRRSSHAHNTQKKHHHSSNTYKQNTQKKSTSNNNKNTANNNQNKNNVNNNQNKSNANTNQNKSNTSTNQNKNTNTTNQQKNTQQKSNQQKKGGSKGGRKR